MMVYRLIAIAQRVRRPCIPDGYIGAVVYVVILALLFAPAGRWVWIALLTLSALATLANIVGVRDMTNLRV
jgi:hypothetical protein